MGIKPCFKEKVRFRKKSLRKKVKRIRGSSQETRTRRKIRIIKTTKKT